MMQLFADYWPACIIGACLAGFTADFIVRFLLPGLRLHRCLDQSIDVFRLHRAGGPVTDLDDLAARAMTTARLRALWHEYAKTLHPQKIPDEFGQSRVARWRAAALAEVFFTDQGVIGSALATGYFEHLPGILTGMGIIGTFSGLIRGLLSFGVSTDSRAVEQSLRSLMKAVGEAFVLSGVAIVLAITLTWLEKMMLSRLSGQLADLRYAIDGLFTISADAEYLDRIMKASETSATQAIQLKDALVSDLRQILTDITSRQVAASEQQSIRLSSDLGKAIQGTLQPIAQAVNTVGQSQGEAVHHLLTDVLAAFSAQMRDTFGGQMEALQRLLESTNEAMQSTAGTLNQLVTNIGQAGHNAAQAMAAQLTETVAGMHARQEEFQQVVLEMLEQMRSVAAASQSEATQGMQRSVATATEDIAVAVGRVQQLVEAAAGRQEEQAGRIIDSLSSQLAQLIVGSGKTNEAMQASVSALSTSTSASVTRMQDGAKALGDASDELARVATRAADALRLASGTSDAMREAADSLASASVTTSQVATDYARTRELFAAMITEFHAIVDTARKDAYTSSHPAPVVPDGIDRQGGYRLSTKAFATDTFSPETGLQSSL